MVTCRELFDGFPDLLQNEVDYDGRAECDKHMVLCPPCGVYFATYRRTVSLTQRLRADEIPEEIRQHLRQFLRGQGAGQ